jgi:hypothetical protein
MEKKNRAKKLELCAIAMVSMFCIMSSVSASHIAKGQSIPLSSNRYFDALNGFSLIPPQNWTQYEGPSPYLVQYLSPYEQGGDTSCYFGIYIQNETASLDDCFEWRLSIIGQFKNVTIFSQSSRSVAAYDSQQVVYEFLSQGIDLKVEEYHFTYDGKHLEIWYVAVPVIFNTYLPSFDQSVSTLLLGNDLRNADSAPQYFAMIILIGAIVAGVVAGLSVLLFSKRKKAVPLPPPPPS